MNHPVTSGHSDVLESGKYFVLILKGLKQGVVRLSGSSSPTLTLLLCKVQQLLFVLIKCCVLCLVMLTSWT